MKEGRRLKVQQSTAMDHTCEKIYLTFFEKREAISDLDLGMGYRCLRRFSASIVLNVKAIMRL